MRALEYLRSPSRLWAIREGAWEEMVVIASGENPSLESLQASLGTLDNKKASSVNVVDGVAIIPVLGPIVRYGNMFSDVSGATSVSKLTKDFKVALEDDSVKSILLEIDSPGGEANGINEFSEMIYNSRGVKPIESYVSGQGCSAAYWIASATDKIYVDETAEVGSIGVAAVARDSSEKDEKEGIKTYKFVSDGSENKRPDLATEEGTATVMRGVNYMADVFRAKVARNRSTDISSLTPANVIDKFNRGGTLMGAEAVEVGMADGISSYTEVLSNLISNGEESSQEITMIENQNVENTVSMNVYKELETKFSTLETKLTDLEKSSLAAEETIKALEAKVAVEAEAAAQAEALKATTELENLTLKAEATAKTFAGKMTPAQATAFVPAYVQNAKDDKASPIEGTSRLDSFLAMWEASEDHGLEEEALSPDNAELANGQVDENVAAMDKLTADAEAYAEEMNKRSARK